MLLFISFEIPVDMEIEDWADTLNVSWLKIKMKKIKMEKNFISKKSLEKRILLLNRFIDRVCYLNAAFHFQNNKRINKLIYCFTANVFYNSFNSTAFSSTVNLYFKPTFNA